jgi:hypothetical protein
MPMAFRRSDTRRTPPQQRGARLHQSLVRTCARSRFNVYTAEQSIDPRDYRALLPYLLSLDFGCGIALLTTRG